jgi:hypothetical protein
VCAYPAVQQGGPLSAADKPREGGDTFTLVPTILPALVRQTAQFLIDDWTSRN